MSAAEPLSPRNGEVARLRLLGRDRRARADEQSFLVEGPKLVAEAIDAGLDVHGVYAGAEWQPDSPLAAALVAGGHLVTALTERAVERIASTTSPQPVVAEVGLPSPSLDHALASATAVLVAADVNDPGNVGTMARSAVAAGFDLVLVLGDSADPWGPKAVRASAGSLFRVPVVVERDIGAGLDALGTRDCVRLGTRMVDAVPCDEADLTGPLALVFGSEAHGLGHEHSSRLDGWLRVPMPGPTESLNVAMTAAILSYEVARQRAGLQRTKIDGSAAPAERQ